MLKPRIIDRYVAAEIIGPFIMGVGLLTFALVTGKLLKLTEMVVNHGVGLAGNEPHWLHMPPSWS